MRLDAHLDLSGLRSMRNRFVMHYRSALHWIRPYKARFGCDLVVFLRYFFENRSILGGSGQLWAGKSLGKEFLGWDIVSWRSKAASGILNRADHMVFILSYDHVRLLWMGSMGISHVTYQGCHVFGVVSLEVHLLVVLRERVASLDYCLISVYWPDC